MSIKTILVHLAADPDHEERLKVAMDIARRNKAHVNALFVTKPLHMPGEVTGRAASASYIASTAREAKRRADQLEQEFADACDRDKISHTWICEDGDHIDMLEKHVHAADLLIVTQVETKFIDEILYPPIPEKLTLISGCPVLVLPIGWTHSTFNTHALVAWKSSRESVRAVRDSLDLLNDAEKVTILAVGPEVTDSLPAEEIQQYLERHGIAAEIRKDFKDKSHYGEIILAHAKDMGADLIVMGAYGGSRFREMVLGGTTREIMNGMDVPVLMSH